MPASLSPLTPDAICAIVVSYNPDASSLDCIRTVLAQAAHTVIIDNRSGEAGRQALRQLDPGRLTLVENPANVGLGTALNQGVAVAAGLGYRWFLLFDQDTKLLADMVAGLVAAGRDCAAELGPKFGLLGTNFFHGRGDDSVEDAKVPYSPGRSWCDRDMVITSGTLLSHESFAAIGPFREDYFIDHIDHEYCLRARRMGYTVAGTVQPLMVHRLGMLNKKRSLLAFGGKKMVSDYSPLRRYYQMRNLRLLARDYGREFPASIGALRQGLRRDTRRAVKYEGQFWLNLMAIVIAWRHARRGILGKYQGKLLLKS